MLDGWYCRSLANEKATKRSSEDDAVQPDEESGSEEESQENEGLEDGQRSPQFIDDQHPAHSDHSVIKTSIDYKSQYRYLKRKLKYLIYENEFFQDALRSNQRRLLKVSRDRAFLLDRLLQYEQPENTSTESEETEESSEEDAVKEQKSKLMEANAGDSTSINTAVVRKGRKRKASIFTTATSEQVAAPMAQQSLMMDSFPGVMARASVRPIVEQQQQRQQPPPPSSSSSQRYRHQHHHHHEEQQMNGVVPLLNIDENLSHDVVSSMIGDETSVIVSSHDDFTDIPTHVAAEECVPMEYSTN